MSKQDSFDRFVSQDANAIVNGAFSRCVSKRTRDAQANFLAAINLQTVDPVAPSMVVRPQLDDTTPPIIPDFPAVTDPDVKPHVVRCWRHDGGMMSVTFQSREAAEQHGRDLSNVIFWKYAITCGREILATVRLPEPSFSFWSPSHA